MQQHIDHQPIIDHEKLSKIAPDRRKNDRRDIPAPIVAPVAGAVLKPAKTTVTMAEVICYVLVIVPWLMGIAASTGWTSWLSYFIPPYAWYVSVELLMRAAHLIP